MKLDSQTVPNNIGRVLNRTPPSNLSGGPMTKLRYAFPTVAAFMLLVGCASNAPTVKSPNSDTKTPPAANREFRAAWVATVGNIDWPTKKGLTAQEQQQEAVAILDKSVDLKLNAIVLQIRTSADALYRSDIEPWS